MRRLIALVLALGALGVTACGTESPDLFVVQRFGEGPNARLRLIVSDTSVQCNDEDRKEMTSEQILDAREYAEKFNEFLEKDDKDKPAVPRTGRIFTFSVRAEEGTLRFADTATEPDVLGKMVRFTRTIAQDVCGLPR